ncbi:MAG: hypothetical protein AAB458_02910 [Patescibacteria group bacterium]
MCCSGTHNKHTEHSNQNEHHGHDSRTMWWMMLLCCGLPILVLIALMLFK